MAVKEDDIDLRIDELLPLFLDLGQGMTADIAYAAHATFDCGFLVAQAGGSRNDGE